MIEGFRRKGLSLLWTIALVAAIVISAGILLDWVASEPASALSEATYVGRSECIDCHQTEYDEWHGSHHDRAMELATEESVLGDFNDIEFERLGQVTRFSRRGDQYWVNAEGPDGENHDYQVKYTFGVEPLQQYMVEMPDGRVQVLRVSWDTNKEEWFYVPPPDAVDVRLPPDDPTHWTGIAQNWNTTCAECHSTNLQKNYDLETDTYQTTWSEIDVSCEACHGPGSLHVKLARSKSLFWDRRHGYGLAKLKSLDPTAELETCATCHSRRAQIHPHYRPGQPLDDYFDVATIQEGLYHADGQMLDEVYVYGSFLQSRMHREGVRCMDCHNPHSLELKFEGSALCTQCHVPAKYDTPTHHFHEMGTPGASCVECHMPATTYMVVDPRRDHSIRVPRPDLTVELGTPNACNNCHTKESEDAEWAAAKVQEWYGPKRPDDPHWARALAAAREGNADKLDIVMKTLRRQTTPAIIQATLVELLPGFHEAEAEAAINEQLQSAHPLVREAAIGAVQLANAQQAVQALEPLLLDPVRNVRIAAAQRLLEFPPSAYRGREPATLAVVVKEFREQLSMSDERAGSHQQLSQLALRSGQVNRAEEELRTAIRLEPYLSGLRGELAQLLSDTGGSAKEIETLRREDLALLETHKELIPEDASIRYRQGILLYRLGDLAAAEEPSLKAVELEPRSYRYALWLATLQWELYRQGDASAYDRILKSIERLAEIDSESLEARSLLRALLQEKARRENPASTPPTPGRG